MEINVKSMIGYTTYMQNRMPSMDMTFSVTEDGHLQMAKFVQEGDVMNGTVMAGQIAGMISKEQTCKEMIDEIMEQAEKLLGRK